MNRSMPGLPVHYQLPEFTQTHVHRVGDAGSIPGLGRSPGEGNGNPLLSILAWKIPWTGEPDRLYSMGLQKVRQTRLSDKQQQQDYVGQLTLFYEIIFIKSLMVVLFALPMIDSGRRFGQCNMRGTQLRCFWKWLVNNSSFSSIKKSRWDDWNWGSYTATRQKATLTTDGQRSNMARHMRRFVVLVSS